ACREPAPASERPPQRCRDRCCLLAKFRDSSGHLLLSMLARPCRFRILKKETLFEKSPKLPPGRGPPDPGPILPLARVPGRLRTLALRHSQPCPPEGIRRQPRRQECSLVGPAHAFYEQTGADTGTDRHPKAHCRLE